MGDVFRMAKYIMALDAGTTSNRCILFDKNGHIVALSSKEFTQFFPHPGWVEHDPNEIWSTQLGVCVEAMQKIGAKPSDIVSIGITNQRETTRQVVTNAMGKAAVATTSAMTSTFIKGVTTAAIKGEEIDLNSISEQTINAYKTGLVLNVASQGLSSINPNLPESVSTIIENTFPAIYEIRNSFHY